MASRTEQAEIRLRLHAKIAKKVINMKSVSLIEKLGFSYADLIGPSDRASFAYSGNCEYQVPDRLYDAMEEEGKLRGKSIDALFCELQDEIAVAPFVAGPVATKLGFSPVDLVARTHYVMRTSRGDVGYKFSDRLYAAIAEEAKQAGRTFAEVFVDLQRELVD
jgi:hypothetical protein